MQNVEHSTNVSTNNASTSTKKNDTRSFKKQKHETLLSHAQPSNHLPHDALQSASPLSQSKTLFVQPVNGQQSQVVANAETSRTTDNVQSNIVSQEMLMQALQKVIQQSQQNSGAQCMETQAQNNCNAYNLPSNSFSLCPSSLKPVRSLQNIPQENIHMELGKSFFY